MIKQKVTAVLSMLTAQFFLGMGLNIIGEPDSDTTTAVKIVAYTLIALHMLTAVGLAVVATQIWRLVKGQSGAISRYSNLGLASMGLALMSGILTISTPLGELFSFLMAAGFMLAFIYYGLVLVRLSSTSKA